MSMQAVIDAARADLGYTESPANSNRTKYGEWYGMNGQPWCVMALAYWFDKAGERMAFFGGGKTASCGTLLRWYREQGLVVPTQQARAGDIGIYNFSGTQEPQHCGLITDVKMAISTIASLTSVEGNTTLSDGAEDNGGIVAEKTRFTKNVVAICRPQYQPEPEVIVPDYVGRWSEEYWVKAISLGIIKEDKDGKYRPKDNATREEVLAMIMRSRGV